MKVSIVIPTYNEEELLPRLLASIRSQRFSDYEVIIADAHSTDTTRKIAKKWRARVIDGGMPGPGRNLGAAAAEGEILLFLDADVMLPGVDWLSRKVRQFEKRGLDCGTCLIKPIHGRVIDHFSHGVYNAHMYATQLIRAHAPGFCIFARKSMHETLSGFDEQIQLAEDHDYVMRASRAGKFRVLNGSRIHVSVRRFDRDGRLATFKKYIKAELYILMNGRVQDGDQGYEFGYDEKGTEKVKEGSGRIPFWKDLGL